ncbi:unnamed protein product [Tilletia laevis]|uniref:FHA domain-containing protein n=2 Tax=Tilletia TaxID=13289 RepID=A0A9N8LHF6_9BASI|nr:unnamed protein product [Tilletia laevis]
MRVGFEPTPFRTTGPAHIITHGSYFSLATSVPGSNNIRVNGHLLHNYTHTLRDGDRVEFGTAYHVGWDEKYDTDGDYQSWPTYSFVSGLSVQVHIAFPLGFDDRRVWTDLCADPVIYRSPTPPTTLILPSRAAPRTSPVLDPREDTKPEPQMDELRKAHTRQLERAARQDASATSSPQGNTSSPTHSLALTPLAIVTSPSSTGRKSPPVRVPYEDLLQSLRSRLTANATGQCPPIDVDTPPCMTFSSLKQVSDDSKDPRASDATLYIPFDADARPARINGRPPDTPPEAPSGIILGNAVNIGIRLLLGNASIVTFIHLGIDFGTRISFKLFTFRPFLKQLSGDTTIPWVSEQQHHYGRAGGQADACGLDGSQQSRSLGHDYSRLGGYRAATRTHGAATSPNHHFWIFILQLASHTILHQPHQSSLVKHSTAPMDMAKHFASVLRPASHSNTSTVLSVHFPSASPLRALPPSFSLS